MPTYSKIPAKLKGQGIAIGAYVIFCNGILMAAKIRDRIHAADVKNGIPAVGFISVKGKRYYYCRYGFVSDPDMYTKPKKKKNKK